MTKRLCQDNTVKHLEACLTSRLVPLDKQPGSRPTGIGEILRRIIEKIVMKLLKRVVLKATGSLQLCAGQNEADSEESTEAVLMVDTSNAFNAINREVFLRSTKRLYPSISACNNNCYL